MTKQEIKLLDNIREGLVKARNDCLLAVSAAPFRIAIAQVDALKIIGDCEEGKTGRKPSFGTVEEGKG